MPNAVAMAEAVPSDDRYRKAGLGAGDFTHLKAEDYFSKVMLTTRPSRYTFPSIPRSNTNVIGASVFGSS
jgi:hypothetical protein